LEVYNEISTLVKTPRIYLCRACHDKVIGGSGAKFKPGDFGKVLRYDWPQHPRPEFGFRRLIWPGIWEDLRLELRVLHLEVPAVVSAGQSRASPSS